MIRHIIKQGNNSYTITLPIKWIRQNHLESNTDIFMQEKENKLIIEVQPQQEKKTITVEIAENNEKNIRFLIQQIYRQNYDTCTLHYTAEETLKTIKKVIDQYFVGLEMTDMQKNRCTLVVIIETTEEKFHLFLRKMFRLILDSLNLLKTAEKESIHYNYLKLYAYQNYAKRYLHSKREELSSYDYYALLSYFINIHSDIDQIATLKQTKNSKEFLEKITKLFEQIEKNFYAQRIDLLMQMPEEMQVHKLQKSVEREEFLTYHYALEISRLMYGALSPLLGILVDGSPKRTA